MKAARSLNSEEGIETNSSLAKQWWINEIPSKFARPCEYEQSHWFQKASKGQAVHQPGNFSNSFSCKYSTQSTKPVCFSCNPIRYRTYQHICFMFYNRQSTIDPTKRWVAITSYWKECLALSRSGRILLVRMLQRYFSLVLYVLTAFRIFGSKALQDEAAALAI